MKGKYNSNRDAILDMMWEGSWTNGSVGECSVPGGISALMCNDESDRQGIMDAFGEDMAACEPRVVFEDLVGNFILNEDEFGFFTVFEFDTPAEANTELNRRGQAYDAWCKESTPEPYLPRHAKATLD